MKETRKKQQIWVTEKASNFKYKRIKWKSQNVYGLKQGQRLNVI